MVNNFCTELELLCYPSLSFKNSRNLLFKSTVTHDALHFNVAKGAIITPYFTVDILILFHVRLT